MSEQQIREARLKVLKDMGLVPMSARLNRNGEVIDENGKVIDWTAGVGSTERAAMLQEVERRTSEEVQETAGSPAGVGRSAAVGAAAGGGRPVVDSGKGPVGPMGPMTRPKGTLDAADEAARNPGQAQLAGTAGAELGAAAIAGVGGATGGTATLTDSGGFFGGGDDGIPISTGPTSPRPDLTPTPGSGASLRLGNESTAGTEAGRVPTEAYAGLTDAQQKLLPTIFSAADRHGVDPAILFGLLFKESKLNPTISSGVNRNGTRDHGIAQINESTLRDLNKSVAWAKNPENAIDYAARRLGGSIKRYGSVDAALIEYNGGQGAADRFMETGRWPYSTAKDYVGGILGIAGQFNPNGIYESDMPDEEDMFPGFSVSLSNPADIKMRAEELGTSVLGRAPTKKEKKLLVAAIQSSQKTSGMGQATAQWVAESGGSAAAADSFAQYANGQIPRSVLAPVGGGHYARPDVAAAWLHMKGDAAKDGVNLTLTDSYRDLATQQRLAAEKGLYSQGGLAAEPGTSNHGWGTAFDVDQGREWLAKNGHKYGFSTIAREPWHWEYKGAGEYGQAATGTEVAGAMSTYTEAPSMDALIEEELERMNPVEAGATDIADAGQLLLNILGGVEA